VKTFFTIKTKAFKASLIELLTKILIGLYRKEWKTFDCRLIILTVQGCGPFKIWSCLKKTLKKNYGITLSVHQ